MIKDILSPLQQETFELIDKTNQNILILGQAGTGKSTFIKHLKTYSAKNIICISPTAISAINIEGQTIHSFFRIPPNDFVPLDILKLKTKTKSILQKSDLLIIDEISMVSPDILDAIDFLCKKALKSNIAFGGIQVVLVGDMFQLPPVITKKAAEYFKEKYGFENSYFFDTPAYSNANFKLVNFDTVYRQNDTVLLSNLQKLRNNDISSIDFFNKCKIIDNDKLSNAVLITPFKSVAENINIKKLESINSPLITYNGEIEGNFDEKTLPAPLKLDLKIGALVIFVKNSNDWVNGSMGKIEKMESNLIKVKLLSGKIVFVKKEKWKKIEYETDENDKLQEKEVGTYHQFPLMLGYAMTIHKSQGKTLDSVIINISNGAFAHGQLYVALSRTKKSEDIHIEKQISKNDLIFDKRVLDFIENGAKPTNKKLNLFD